MITAGLYNIHIVKGTDFSINFVFPYNVHTHYSFEAKIKDFEGTEIVEFTTSNPSDGNLTLSLTDTQTASIEGEGLVFDIIQTQTQTGFITQVIRGNVTIEESVTLG